MMVLPRSEAKHGGQIHSGCASQRGDGGWEKTAAWLSHALRPFDFHALTGALHPPTCDHDSKLRSPRCLARTPRDLEHVKFPKLVIVTHDAHAAGALSPIFTEKEAASQI